MAEKQLSPIDMAGNEIWNLVTQNLASAPSSPKQGQRYFDTTMGLEGYYTGTQWIYLGTSSGGNVSKAANAGAAGVLQVAGGTDRSIADYTGGAGLLKSSAGGVVSPAVAGTDYAAPPGGNGLLKGNGAGGFATAAAGTDYVTPTGDGSQLTGLTQSQISGLAAALALLAPLSNAALTGTPTAPTPASATGIANKGYVDSVAQGLSVKGSAKAVATSNITLSGTQAVDGVALTAGDRALATGQTTASQNGPWIVAAGAWSRPADFASGASELGSFVFVEGGTVNAASGWVLSGTSAVTVDTTSQTWTQFSGAGEVLAGTGLAKSGNQLSIENGGVLTVPHGGTGVATLTGLVKGNGAGAMTAAVAKTDYAPATSGSLVLKGDGAGGFANAKYTGTIGDGTSTSITVTHNLGTADCTYTVKDATTGQVVRCDVTFPPGAPNTAIFGFTTAPAANAYKIVIMG